MKHANHDWYVTNLVKATRVRDWSLVDSLKRDLGKMPIEQSRAIRNDVAEQYKGSR